MNSILAVTVSVNFKLTARYCVRYLCCWYGHYLSFFGGHISDPKSLSTGFQITFMRVTVTQMEIIMNAKTCMSLIKHTFIKFSKLNYQLVVRVWCVKNVEFIPGNGSMRWLSEEFESGWFRAQSAFLGLRNNDTGSREGKAKHLPPPHLKLK